MLKKKLRRAELGDLSHLIAGEDADIIGLNTQMWIFERSESVLKAFAYTFKVHRLVVVAC